LKKPLKFERDFPTKNQKTIEIQRSNQLSRTQGDNINLNQQPHEDNEEEEEEYIPEWKRKR
jgi:hypothetical protein